MMKLAVTLAALVGAAHGQDCDANEPDLTDANMGRPASIPARAALNS